MIDVRIRRPALGEDFRPFTTMRWPSRELCLNDLRMHSTFAMAFAVSAIREPIEYPEFTTIGIDWTKDGEPESVTLLVPK